MNTPWILNTQGDPLRAIRRFLQDLWRFNPFKGMLVPIYLPRDAVVAPQLVDSAGKLAAMDPFAPVTKTNAAKQVRALARRDPQGRYGALLRPCEVRSLGAMIKRDSFKLDNWVVIGIDCLAAFPAKDFGWRAERAGGVERLTEEVLRFARLGGILPYRFRKSCQMCSQCWSEEADLNIGVMGIPVREYILVTPKDERTAQQLVLHQATHGRASPEKINKHEKTLGRVDILHDRVRDRLTKELPPELPRSVGGLISLLAKCAPCKECLNACPIYNGELDVLSNGGSVSMEAVTRWLAFCSQCGMCEDVCPKETPLTAIVGSISRKLNLANPSLAV